MRWSTDDFDRLAELDVAGTIGEVLEDRYLGGFPFDTDVRMCGVSARTCVIRFYPAIATAAVPVSCVPIVTL